jgi:RecA-family ATPase
MINMKRTGKTREVWNPKSKTYDVVAHARAYIAAMPASISGQGGHSAAYSVACTLIQGFGLNLQDAMMLFREYNTRSDPFWNEKEIEHKMKSAEKADPPSGGKGSMASKGVDFQTVAYIPKKVEVNNDFLDLLYNCFEASDYLSIAEVAVGDSGRRFPSNGGDTSKTRDEWINLYKQNCGGNIQNLLPSPHGSWIRINPMVKDGKSDKDVSEFRYCLIESDNLPVDEQEKILRESGLPIAAIIDSAGKSIHAWVRVDATNIDEYHERREKLWEVLPHLNIDEANKNPSRFSRMAGCFRGTKKQKLLAVNLGPKSYREWENRLMDTLPPIVSLCEMINTEIPKPKEVIKNIIHEGCKMLFTGGSKAKKTWLMMDAALSVISAGEFLGHRCNIGNVLYINFELMPWFARDRFDHIRKSRGLAPELTDRLKIWNLRGYSAPFEVIRPKFLEYISSEKYSMIIIDPLYKTLGARDENNAGDINSLMNEITLLAEHTGASVVVATHQTKGNSAGKKNVDMASGSGVFGRDPDTIMSIVEHETIEDVMVCHQTFRNHKPMASYCAKWDEEKFRFFPTDDSIEPEDNKEAIMEILLSTIGGETRPQAEVLKEIEDDHNIKRSVVSGFIKKADRLGVIAKEKLGKQVMLKVLQKEYKIA